MRIADGLSDECATDAVDLVFEYMAATLGEGGRQVPSSVRQLPTVLRRECEDLPVVYASPGALFVAYQDDQPIGCVGLAPGPFCDAAEVRRLYVRAAHRKGGVARALMDRARSHAERQGFARLVLDVLPARGHVIDFYRRLGYVDCEPFATQAPTPMVYLQRPVARDVP